MAKLICETYPQVGEVPENAKWYKNGQLFQPYPRAKVFIN